MELADILARRAVLFCTDVKTKSQLFDHLAKVAAELTERPAEDIRDAIAGREELGSTGLGNGLAIPHGKVAGLKTVTAVFARLAEPIDFDAVDDEPVDLVVMLLAPTGAGADHLKALSRVARLLRTEAIVEELRRTEDPERLHALLTAPLQTPYAA
jgi:nitrogen PTS system EIIA component